MTDLDFMRRLRAWAESDLEMIETATRLLPDDILDQTIERRVALRSLIKEYDTEIAKLAAQGFSPDQ